MQKTSGVKMRSTNSAPTSPDYGYFAADSDEECDIRMEAEPDERYLKNLYCPLRIGQVLGSRPQFRIEHKLGWGGFSTVWLARNLSTDRLVALKVMSSGWRGEHERQMNKEIFQRVAQNISSHFIIAQAAFSIPGCKGNRHGVLVFPWRGPSVQAICLQLPASFRVRAAEHLLISLKHLHAAGIIHSDINEGNAIWDIDAGSDRLSTAEVYQRFGRPRKIQLNEEHGGAELVEPIQFPTSSLQPKLYLGDFGHSVVSGSEPSDPVQLPLLYCAPERFHGMKQSFASDMWSFMMLFARLYQGSEIAYGRGSAFVSRLVNALGPFPANWQNKNGFFPNDKDYAWWYDPKAKEHLPAKNKISLESRLDWGRPEISRQERALALEVFRKGFQYLPEKRLTAAQLLRDPSFRALMAYYET